MNSNLQLMQIGTILCFHDPHLDPLDVELQLKHFLSPRQRFMSPLRHLLSPLSRGLQLFLLWLILSVLPGIYPSSHQLWFLSALKLCNNIGRNEQFEVLTNTFATISKQKVPADFLFLAAIGMQMLHDAGRSNSIYLLAKALGTMRRDGSDSLLPTKRMPMGLIQYVVAFFMASSVQKVHYKPLFLCSPASSLFFPDHMPC